MGRKLGGALPPFWGWKLDLHLAQIAWTEAHLYAKCHLDPSNRLATIDMGRKLGALPPFWGWKLRPYLMQRGHGRGLPACQVSP